MKNKKKMSSVRYIHYQLKQFIENSCTIKLSLFLLPTGTVQLCDNVPVD